MTNSLISFTDLFHLTFQSESSETNELKYQYNCQYISVVYVAVSYFSTQYIKWKILKKAKPYSNTTKRCNLCMEEKYIIMFKPEMASLNQRGGVVTSCLHSRKFLLTNHPG